MFILEEYDATRSFEEGCDPVKESRSIVGAFLSESKAKSEAARHNGGRFMRWEVVEADVLDVPLNLWAVRRNHFIGDKPKTLVAIFPSEASALEFSEQQNNSAWWNHAEQKSEGPKLAFFVEEWDGGL